MRVVIFFYSFICLFTYDSKSQVANYINNGSFEALYDCNGVSLMKVKNWLSIDSTAFGAGFMSNCNNKVPWNANTYQKPRTGNTYALSTWYCPSCPLRGYLKNRLKSTLQNGKVYCVKFYVNIANTSPYGMDGFGIYFGNNTIDTITKLNSPLSYLIPQVKNPIGNVIKDTLNWVLVTGTFTANGTEKYALLGNFLADNAVTTGSIGGPQFPQNWTDVCIDDVSCIELNLPAFAGRDTSVAPGNNIFLGRQPDVGIDEACVWYKLPSTTPIDTVAGFWVNPTTTSTYVVVQTICGLVKSDTVVVHMNLVGLEGTEWLSENLNIFPNPVENKLRISSNIIINSKFKISVTNLVGQVLFTKDDFKLEDEIEISFLPNGIYYLKIENESGQKVFKVLKE